MTFLISPPVPVHSSTPAIAPGARRSSSTPTIRRCSPPGVRVVLPCCLAASAMRRHAPSHLQLHTVDITITRRRDGWGTVIPRAVRDLRHERGPTDCAAARYFVGGNHMGRRLAM